MSYTERHIGKLIPIQIKENVSLSEYAEGLCLMNGLDVKALGNSENDFINVVNLELRHEYHINLDTLTIYKVEDKELTDCEELFEISKAEDGSIKYLVEFYNGGGSFDEVIEKIVKKLS